MKERPSVEIARIIGQPLDVNFPVSVELLEICNIQPVLPAGERAYVYTDAGDLNGVDTIYISGADGEIVPVKVELSGVTEIDFAYLQTKLEYVLVQELAESPDQLALARRKSSMSRAMDKEELKRCLALILSQNGSTGTNDQQVVRTTGEDIYDLIVAMVRKIENYATDYVLLAGTTAYREIEDYDKTMASGTFEYAVPIKQMLADRGIKLIRVFESVKLDNSSDDPILAVDKLILVGRNSKIINGEKPIVFCRRAVRSIVNSGTVDTQERALYVADVPTVIDTNKMIHAYGVFSFESFTLALTNYRATCWATA